MKISSLHEWAVTPARAISIQQELSQLIIKTGKVRHPRFIAGVDLSIERPRGKARAAVVTVSYPELEAVETKVVEGEVNFPYVPGLLTFREAPLALEAFSRLSTAPDLVLVDGQGIAHPRRIGIASHLGLILDIPAIGCAKSRLCGEYEPPLDKASSYAPLTDREEVIGAVVRTRQATKTVYVSVGHKISLENAIFWVLQVCRGFRIPEPLRLAHMAAGKETVKAGESCQR